MSWRKAAFRDCEHRQVSFRVTDCQGAKSCLTCQLQEGKQSLPLVGLLGHYCRFRECLVNAEAVELQVGNQISDQQGGKGSCYPAFKCISANRVCIIFVEENPWNPIQLVR